MWNRIILILALLASPLAAHGGAYRGPSSPSGASAPGTGGATAFGGRAPVPSTGSLGIATSGGTGWQLWWEHNKDPYLRLKEAVQAPGELTGGEDFYLGAGGRNRSTLAPSESEKRDIILPALKRLLDSSENMDIATACMVAMAKIGTDHPDVEVLQIFRDHLQSRNQEIRETAALCLGISQRVEALDDLLALALDTKLGRKMLNRAKVDDRSRSFAIYGLGLLAWSLEDSGDKQKILIGLSRLLEDKRVKDRDMQVAIVQSLGLMNFDVAKSLQKRLLWQAVDLLWGFYERRLGKGDQLIQAHVPTSLARLLGRGQTLLHERFKAALAQELDRKRGRQNSIYQSAALALGKMLSPPEIHAADEIHLAALLRYAKHGKNELARNFAMIALGEVGGSQNRSDLLRLHAKGNKVTVKPWAGIALGLIAFRSRASGKIDRGIGEALLAGLRDEKNPDTRAAHAVALGLSGYERAAKDMRQFIQKYRRNDITAGYLSIGLAMMDDQNALPQIRALVTKSARRPYLLAQAAVALGKLGDKQAINQLNRLVSIGAQNVAKMSAVASAYRFIGDRRAMSPLVEMMFDDEHLTKISRAFVAAALGGIADKELFPWNAKIAIGTNYAAAVSTLTNGMTGVLDIL